MRAAETSGTEGASTDMARRHLRLAALPGGPAATDPAATDPAATDPAATRVHRRELRVRQVRVVRTTSVSTVRADASTVRADASTVRASASTVRASASTVRADASTVRASASTVRASASTVRASASQSVTDRAQSQSRLQARPRSGGRARDAARPRPGPLRLTPRGRLVVTGLAVIIVIVAVTLLWVGVAGSVQASSRRLAPRSPYEGMTQVVVRPGQTLWSIAASADPSADPWAVVQQISEVNALNGPMLQAGQLLWVPKG